MKTKLGTSTPAPEQYSPSVLDFIPRALSRTFELDTPWAGSDVWHAFEFSWLDARGSPETGVIRIDIPVASKHIVESKSLKLYLNSFAFERLESSTVAVETIQKDLSAGLGVMPVVTLLSLEASTLMPQLRPKGYCVDGHTLRDPIFDAINPSLLQCGSSERDEILFSNNLRSLCPVTAQPDWATVFVMYRGNEILPESLHAFVASFRKHQGFHEACCERIFYDIHTQCRPTELSVMCCFTRRGGIDITPIRGYQQGHLLQWMRTVRQ
jgi:7-cyano-7-deazaguanine reductase